MRKRATVIIAATLAVVMMATFLPGCREKHQDTVEIGAILSLTGNAAAYGKRAQRGIDLAVQETNAAGGINNREVTVLYEDDKGDPKEGVTAVNKLIRIDRVPVILGPQISGVAMAVAPIAQNGKTVLILPGANTPQLNEVGDYIFRNMPSSDTDGTKAAEVIYSSLGLKQAVVTYPTNAGSTGIAKAFIRQYNELGGKVLLELGYDPEMKDFRTNIVKIAETKSSIVYIPGYSTDVGLFVKQAAEMKLSAIFFGAPAMQSTKFLEIAGQAAEGAMFTNVAFDPEADDTHISNFTKAFQAKHGIKPDVFAAMAYDAAKLAIDGIAKRGYDAKGIKGHLHGVVDYPGVSGETTFDDQGNVRKTVGVFVVQNGQFKPWSR